MVTIISPHQVETTAVDKCPKCFRTIHDEISEGICVILVCDVGRAMHKDDGDLEPKKPIPQNNGPSSWKTSSKVSSLLYVQLIAIGLMFENVSKRAITQDTKRLENIRRSQLAT